MMRRLTFVLGIFLTAAAAFAAAPPNAYRGPKYPPTRLEADLSWREGGYITVGVAMLQNNRDTNIISGETFGDPIDAAIHLGFGWGINEHVAAGIDMRIANPHATFDGAQYSETAARVDLIGRYALLPQWGVRGPRLTITPYVKGGGLIYAAVVKGGARDESKVAAYGTGLLAGGGMEFNFGQRPAFLIDIGLDAAMVVFDARESNGVAITASGVSPQIGGVLAMGIRF